MIYAIQKIHHSTLTSRSCSWVSMKRGDCKFKDGKTRSFPLSTRNVVETTEKNGFPSVCVGGDFRDTVGRFTDAHTLSL